LKKLKESLVAEVKDNNNYLKKSITNYLDMFDSGLTEKSTQCSVCKNITTKDNAFEEFILYFDQSHHDDNNKLNNCTLRELLMSYFATNNDNLEHECQACNKTTRMIEQNRICCYPEILCIFLCRNKWKYDTVGRILSPVDFPVENFKPNEHFGINEGTDDTTYDLVASVNHYPQPNNGGHYTAICQQHELGRWYEYDDAQVKMANFIKMSHGIPKVKMQYQRSATILFYIKKANRLLRSTLAI
jgi:hypothetical protein